MIGGVLILALGVLGTGVSPVPDVPAAAAPAIAMTAVNWGHPVSLLDPAHPGWSHLAPMAGPTEVTATIQLHGLRVQRWVAHLDAPAAYGGAQSDDCQGTEKAAPTELSCVFKVPVSSGVNPLTVTFSADDQVLGDAQGFIQGGELQWDAGYQVLDATGNWTAIPRDQAVALPATAPTAVREVLTNTGTIPMRVDTAPCDTRVLAPHAQLVCPLRGVRPAQSLAGELRGELRVMDAVGGIAGFEIRGGLTTFAGSFSLSRVSAIVGQPIVVRAQGLPVNQAFAVQYRLDDRSSLLGTSITRTGMVRWGFVLPASSPGTYRLNVVHDGVTIVSLPFEVTRVSRATDAAPPPWGLLAILIVVLVALLVAWRVRRRRRTAAVATAAAVVATAAADAVTASPEPPQTDPSPDAIPATPEPAADRLR